MHETALDIYKTKRQAMEEGHGDDGKKDIISILSEIFFFFCRALLDWRRNMIVRANESATEEDRLTDEELFGQVAYVTYHKAPESTP